MYAPLTVNYHILSSCAQNISFIFMFKCKSEPLLRTIVNTIYYRSHSMGPGGGVSDVLFPHYHFQIILPSYIKKKEREKEKNQNYI